MHASTWLLSRKLSRSAVVRTFKLAYEQSKIVSLDPNYTTVVWPDYQEAQQVMQDICRYVTIIKASLDDANRFFGPGYEPAAYIEMLHELGSQTVIFTMGRKGTLLAKDGHLVGRLPIRPIKAIDATGAGDAFWAGFLVAMLDGHSLEYCLLFAREIVEMKLTTVGPLPAAIDRHEIYARLPDPSSEISLG